MRDGARLEQSKVGGAEPYILDVRETDQSYMDLIWRLMPGATKPGPHPEIGRWRPDIDMTPVGPSEGSISRALAALDFGSEPEEAPAGPAP